MNPTSLTLPASIHAAGDARAALGQEFADAGLQDDICGNVLLAMSEAINNAWHHAHRPPGGDVTILVTHLEDELHVTVADTGIGWIDGDTDSGDGFGLKLMREVADCTHSLTDGGGTTVLMRFART